MDRSNNLFTRKAINSVNINKSSLDQEISHFKASPSNNDIINLLQIWMRLIVLNL